MSHDRTRATQLLILFRRWIALSTLMASHSPGDGNDPIKTVVEWRKLFKESNQFLELVK